MNKFLSIMFILFAILQLLLISPAVEAGQNLEVLRLISSFAIDSMLSYLFWTGKIWNLE